MADPNNTRGAPPRDIHIGKKKTNWLAWLLLALGVLALLLALSRCSHRDAAAVATSESTTTETDTSTSSAQAPVTPPVAVHHITLPNGKVVDLEPKTLNYNLQAFLSSSAAAPQTFTFEKLNFDTASSAIRADDRPTLAALSQILAAYPKAKIRLVGYADTRGSDATNTKLGADRAAAVAKALGDAGVDAARITTASGGDNNPVATNDTAGGQFANRRSELVVTSK